MVFNQSSAIKRAQKESLLMQELSKMLLQLSLDDNRLQGIFINRVKLSQDKGVLTVYFYMSEGLEAFQEKLHILILYKPSLRKALASAVPSRYVPELVFKFDELFDKQQRLDELFEKSRTMELFNTFVLIPLWLCWGSFLNVLSYRLVRGQNIATPGSRCPACHHAIAWFDNIPVISWVLLGGSCRHCKKPISILYPCIELLTAIVMTLLLILVPLRFAPAYFILFSALIVSIRSDLETLLISQYVTIFLVPIGFLCAHLGLLPITPLQSLAGSLFGYLFLWILASLFLVLTGKKGMGEGDFELLALIGSFLGIHGTWLTLVAGSVTGSLIGISLIMRGSATRTTKIPFGPFLALSAIIYVLCSFVYWPNLITSFF